MYYVIKHKQSGKFMPEYKTGKGYSFWLYDENVDNHLHHPRLIESEKKAKKVCTEWAKGVFEWVTVGGGPYDFDQRRKIKDVGRSVQDLEIIPVVINRVLQ